MATMRCTSCANVQGVYLGRGSKLADVTCASCHQAGMLIRADKGQARRKQVQTVREKKKPAKPKEPKGPRAPIDRGKGLWCGMSRPAENWRKRLERERGVVDRRIVRSANGWKIETRAGLITRRSQEFETRLDAERAFESAQV
jgi:ribosomal protein S27E